MDQSEDVERLFSWLKAPMVHYREFAPQIEIAEAAAAWPAVHKAAVETGAVGDEVPAPQGYAAAQARIARDRMVLPSAAAQAAAADAAAMAAAPTPGRQADRPADPGLVETLGQRLREERAATHEASSMPAGRSASEPGPEMMTFEEPLPGSPVYREEPRVAERAPPPSSAAQARQQGGLFGGEYRGREREVRSDRSAADRRDRSLDAVFSRMSGARESLPDPRARTRTTPGLGAVFGRLR